MHEFLAMEVFKNLKNSNIHPLWVTQTTDNSQVLSNYFLCEYLRRGHFVHGQNNSEYHHSFKAILKNKWYLTSSSTSLSVPFASNQLNSRSRIWRICNRQASSCMVIKNYVDLLWYLTWYLVELYYYTNPNASISLAKPLQTVSY